MAQRIAGHADSRTTKLYDRRGQKVLVEEHGANQVLTRAPAHLWCNQQKNERRSDTQIPLIRLATRLMLERGLGTSSWSEKHVDVCPIKLSELHARGEPVAREGNLRAWIVSGP